MEQKQNNAPFPGQKKGLIRIFLKGKDYDGTAQLSCDFLNSGLESVPFPSRIKIIKRRKKQTTTTNEPEQLSFDFFVDESESE